MIASWAISSLTCNHFALNASRAEGDEPRANGSGRDGIHGGSAASFTHMAGLIGAFGACRTVTPSRWSGVADASDGSATKKASGSSRASPRAVTLLPIVFHAPIGGGCRQAGPLL